MQTLENEVLGIFRESGALLEGHFMLRSGLHSAHFFQCARVCEHMQYVIRLAELLIQKVRNLEIDMVLPEFFRAIPAIKPGI